MNTHRQIHTLTHTYTQTHRPGLFPIPHLGNVGVVSEEYWCKQRDSLFLSSLNSSNAQEPNRFVLPRPNSDAGRNKSKLRFRASFRGTLSVRFAFRESCRWDISPPTRGPDDLNYINGYVSKASDSLDFSYQEHAKEDGDALWRKAFRILQKSSPAVPEVTGRSV